MSLYYVVQLNKNSFSSWSLYLSCKVVVTAECHAFRLLIHSFLAPKKLQANKSRVGFPAAAGKSKEV